jgi:LmbE family N-acetylglucosaminyl deacetylase
MALFQSWPLFAQSTASSVRIPLSDLGTLRSTDRVLVIAPHPDDETLCCAGVIRRALAARAQVEVVWLTNGDAFEIDAELVERTFRLSPERWRDFAMRRAQEAKNAASILGIPPAAQVFLGYPDRGLLPMMLDNYYFPYTSRYTKEAAVWYEGAQSRGSAYEGCYLQRDLQLLIDRVRPTHVLAPSPLDQHPDHRAAGALVIRIFGERNELDRVRYWIVHGGAGWPAPRGLHSQLALSPPPRHRDVNWETAPLTFAERDLKRSALLAYHTQMEIMPRYLFAFVRSNELFSRHPLPADISTPTAQP